MHRVRIKVAAPYFPDTQEILKDIGRVLESGHLMNGPFSSEFEQEISRKWGVKEAVTLNSCTTALQIALSYWGAKNKRVLVSTNTYVATANAILYSGGKPIFCDLASGGLSPGEKEFEARITQDTVGLVFTHVAGIVDPGYLEVKAWCDRKGIFLIEDCAHAHGARMPDHFVGTRSHAGCFSFYPTKIITTGTGGLLTANDSGLAEYARSMRFHGRAERPYEHDKAGNDWFMNEVSAVLGLHQLRRLEEFIERRCQLANFYRTHLQSLSRVTFFTEGEGRSVYYKLPVLLDSTAALNQLRKYWDARYGLECEPLYYPPCHMQPIFSSNPDIHQFQCVEAERILSRQFCLPIHLRLTDEEAMEVVKSLEDFSSLDS